MSVVARLLRRTAASDAPAGPRRASRLAGIAAAVSAAALGAVLLLAPGTNGAYTASIRNTNNTAASSAAFFTCSSAFAADRADALFAYPLNEATGSTTAVDAATGAYPGTYRGAMASDTTSTRACPRDTGGAYVLDGSDFVTNALQARGPAVFSTEVWFKTTVKGGKLIGFGNSQSGSSSAYDRHTYISTTGQLAFGTYNGGYQTIVSPASVADGAWHHVVATMSSAGMVLYLDGARVAGNAAFTAPESNSGYWRIGYDNTSGWPNAGSAYFVGSMRFAAVYKTALTPAQVQAHYTAGR
ncbi:LamG domain-containing protein [Clavibacter zhangzhiyongii]|uniref:LamG domain-containing protein n=1 Tax=Clavibacter zhangzhiyongii TaxID=2768071 RepID=A0A7L7Z2F7_9MICO|nr:LamG domain-containing protein [Clavibacter zhangzhiyongii]QOD43867.1 LamG domain-containing protein [Clavibacter zhangzhiyongii]